MRHALSGKSGTIIDKDYKGHIVLAGFETIKELGMGIVAKIDLSEVREPYIKAGAIVIGLTLLVCMIGVILFTKISEPVIKKIFELSILLANKINKRIDAEESLRESEERYRRVVEEQTDIICRFKPDGTYNFANEVYCQSFGKSKKELIDYNWFSDTYPEDLDMIKSKLSAMSSDNPIVILENRVISGKEKHDGYSSSIVDYMINMGNYRRFSP